MVTDQAKWVLVGTKLDPLKVAKVWQITEAECWDYINDYSAALNAAERAHNALGTRKELHEWIDTIPERKSVKLAVLKEKLQIAQKHPERYDIKRLLREVAILTGKVKNITPQDIERAKEYPIDSMLVVKRGMALCPFHGEKTPSFQVKKNNTFICYGCGQYGDSIDLYQKIHNVSFIEAVKVLGG